jgi:hypothetical protein
MKLGNTEANEHAMDLITRFLPHYQFAEEHSRFIPTTPACVLDVLNRPEVVDDRVVRGLVAAADAQTFAALDTAGIAKLVVSFTLEPEGAARD